MKKILPVVFSLLAVIVAPSFSGAKGTLFIIGGGDRPESMMRRFVDLAGRFGRGKIVVFPMASSEPAETGARLRGERPRKAVRLKRSRRIISSPWRDWASSRRRSSTSISRPGNDITG
jgi:hypothetical protein